MAYRNKTIRNTETGQEIKFIQTGKDNSGELLEMESTFDPYSKEPPPHYHPFHEEDFTVLSGQLTVRMNRRLVVLNAGDQLHIPRNTVHSMWNNSDDKITVNWKARPALNFDNFLETAMGLAARSKSTGNGKPGFLENVLLAKTYSNVFRLASPPFAIQRVLFLILAPVAYLSGFRPAYREFLD